MRSLLLPLLLLGLLVVPSYGQITIDANEAAADAAFAATVVAADVAPEPIAPTALTIPVDAVAFDAATESPEGLRRLSRKEKRDLGITFFGLVRKSKQLYTDGEIDATMDRSVIAATVFMSIAQDNPQAFADATVNWDAILEFIEKLLPLIMTIIGMFS